MRLKRVIGMMTLICLLLGAFGAMAPQARAAAKYYITVDITNQIVTVYKNGNISESGIVRQMICSTGKSGTPTPTGAYALPSKRYSSERREWYYFPKYNCYAKWATRIVGGILFHSVLYTASKVGPTRASVGALGSQASHGCVRLRVDDARWIAQNCPAGTWCRIYKSGKVNADLRRRLLKKSFSSAGESYGHFMGRTSDGDTDKLLLEKGSRGTKVRQLQARLKALGFLDDVADGIFGSKTQTAVKRFQAALGKAGTGKVDDALWARVFADTAPTGTYVTLVQGMSGPAVKVMQQALADLKLYTGGLDGIFGGGTGQAVRDYQRYFGFAVSGKANQALQKAILKRAAEVKSRFGGGAYRLVTGDEAVGMARLKTAANLYAKSKTSAKKLARLKKKTEVVVISKIGGWSRVSYDGQTGYIQNKYLSFFKGSRPVATYEPADQPKEDPEEEPEAEPTPSPTPEIFIPTPTPEIFIPTSAPEA